MTQWDVFASTGGSDPSLEVRGTASRNISSLTLDSAGLAGSAGSVWVVTQSPVARLGRLDPTTNSYTQWPLFNQYESGTVESVALNPTTSATNPARGDLWMTVAGNPSFILKLRGVNTLRKFKIAQPVIVVPEGITVSAQGSAYAAIPETNYYGGMILRIARDAASGSFLTGWASTAIQPRHVTLDSSGRVWFTNTAANTVARLDTATNVLTQWPLYRSNPTGLHVSGSQVCVVTAGIPPVESGEVQCLDPGTNALTRFTRAATSNGWVDYPQQIVRNAFGELFVTEQRGNAVLFLGTQAYSTGQVTALTPTTSTLGTVSIEVNVEDETIAAAPYSLVSSSADLQATDIGNGWVRFGLPSVPQTDLEPLDRHPQPAGLSQVFNDSAAGLGTVYVADAFDGPLGSFRGARVGRFDLLPPRPVIGLSESSVSFTATVGDAAATPATRQVTITNTGDGTLNWTAVASDAWIHVLPASGTSIGDPSTVSISVDVPTSGGTSTGTVTITAPGVTPQTITVTLETAALPSEISLGSTSLTFAANRGSAAPAAQSVQLTNSGGEPLAWSLGSLPSWLQVTPASGTLAAAASTPLSFVVNHAALAKGSYNATVTISAPDSSNGSASVNVALTVTAPTIGVGSPSLTFTADQGASVSQPLTISNTGDGTLAFTPTLSAAWLSVSPAGVITIAPGASVTLTVTAATSSLAPGSYTGSITIGDSFATNGTQMIGTSLTVNASGVITLTPASVALSIAKGASAPSQSVTVGNSGGAEFSYTAAVTAGSSWLSIAAGASGPVAPAGTSVLTLALNTAGLGLGTHSGSVQITATDAANSPRTVAVSVEVKDTSKPVLTLPSSPTVAATGPAGGVVTYSASATDDSGVAPTVTCSPASGTTFPLGTTTVSCSATDGAGNTETGTFTVTVRDQVAPLLTVPASFTREATSGAGAVVTYAVSASDAVDSTPTISCTPASGSTFPLGTRVVSCTATDDSGNVTSGSFSVTVQDTTPPVLSLPANISTVGTSSSGAVVTFSASALDAVSGSVPVTCTPASGSTFPIGNTVVACTATDAAARTAAGSFTVSVASPASFSLSPASMYYKTGRLAYCNGVAVGSNWKDQGLVVTNTGGTSLTVTSTTGTAWVKVPAAATIAPGATVTLTVSVNLSGLSRGIYQGSLTLSGNSGAVVQNVPVTLEVGNALPTVCLTPTSTLLGSVKAGKVSATKYFDVLNVGDDPLGSWTVAKAATNGTVNTTASSGSGPKTIGVSVKAGTRKGTQTGTVTVNAPGAVQSGTAVNLTWTVQ